MSLKPRAGGYPFMKLLKKSPHRFGWLVTDQWYWRYPNGDEVPFRTDTWDGVSLIERLGVKRDEG